MQTSISARSTLVSDCTIPSASGPWTARSAYRLLELTATASPKPPLFTCSEIQAKSLAMFPALMTSRKCESDHR